MVTIEEDLEQLAAAIRIGIDPFPPTKPKRSIGRIAIASFMIILIPVTCNNNKNFDNLLNVQDVILTVNFILQNQYDSSADLNGDGGVNVQDVILIMNIILAG